MLFGVPATLGTEDAGTPNSMRTKLSVRLTVTVICVNCSFNGSYCWHRWFYKNILRNC